MGKENSIQESAEHLSIGKIIDIIRSVRNDLVKEFLNDTHLNAYFEKEHKTLSNVKREFLKRELKELLISPVDLVHYAGLINHIKETCTASITEGNFIYFYNDVEKILKKYTT